MQQVVYGYWASLPSKVGAAFVALCSLFATLKPDKANAWLAWLMTPEQTQFWGIIGVILALAWLVVLLLLKPKPRSDAVAASGPVATSGGDGTNALAIANARDVYVTGGQQPVPDPKAADTYGPRGLEALYGDEPLRGDMDFSEVLIRVYLKLGKAPQDTIKKKEFHDKVDRELSKGVRDHGMSVWGYLGKIGPELIRGQTLTRGHFEHQQQEFIFWADGERAIRFKHLEFNRSEVDRIWPKPPPKPPGNVRSPEPHPTGMFGSGKQLTGGFASLLNEGIKAMENDRKR